VTEENKRANIQDQLARAEGAGRSADLLFEHGQLHDAISRLYYSVYHTVRALLLTRSLQPRTHEGTLTLLSLHFVKPGIFEPADAHILTRLMKYRQEADYNASYVFTPADYQEFRKEAWKLIDRIRKHLQQTGYL
jgi:uncharacterized protein (UPF0332 family)